MKTTKIKVKVKGAPIVNGAYIYRSVRDIVTIAIDMRSKYCECEGSCDGGGCNDEFCPEVYIVASKYSRHLNKNVRRDSSTCVEFCNYAGWKLWNCMGSRYTIYVCLVRPVKD
jgi:hypothetical protein